LKLEKEKQDEILQTSNSNTPLLPKKSDKLLNFSIPTISS